MDPGSASVSAFNVIYLMNKSIPQLIRIKGVSLFPGEDLLKRPVRIINMHEKYIFQVHILPV